LWHFSWQQQEQCMDRWSAAADTHEGCTGAAVRSGYQCLCLLQLGPAGMQALSPAHTSNRFQHSCLAAAVGRVGSEPPLSAVRGPA
jgi:hypothetical protein